MDLSWSRFIKARWKGTNFRWAFVKACVFYLVTCWFFGAANAATWQGNTEQTLGMKLGVQTGALKMVLQDPEGKIPITYEPKVSSRAFISGSYGPFALFLGTSLPRDEEDRRMYGSSSESDWQFRFYGRQLTWDFFFQDYQGFYIDNTVEVDPTRTETSPKLQRGDLHTRHYGVQLFYTFNPESYSMGSAFDHTTRQTASGGSWVGVLGLTQFQVYADSPLVPANLRAQYGDFGTFSDGNFITFDAGGGYGYTYVYGDYYIGGLLTLNAGSQYQKYELATSIETRSVLTADANIKFSFGSNGEIYFWGLTAQADTNTAPIEKSRITFTSGETSLFWGMRFMNTPIPFLDSVAAWLSGT